MASLIARILVGAVLVAALAVTLPPAARGQDSTSEPVATRSPTCNDRFPAEGPAGVDLRLGCIVSELVGLYTASSSEEPPTLSAYVVVLGAGIVGAVLIGALALRLLARRASRRLAPVLPAEWWVCSTCRSVNAVAVSRCYACGGPPGDGPTMPTDGRPEITQPRGRSPRS